MTGVTMPVLVSPNMPSTCTAGPDVTVTLTCVAPAGGEGNKSAITSRVIFLPAVPLLEPMQDERSIRQRSIACIQQLDLDARILKRWCFAEIAP